jgi:hypothetical protein
MTINLLIEARARLYRRRKVRNEGSSARSRIREVVEKWQEHRRTRQIGRTIFGYFEIVKERLESGWVRPDHYMTQFLSGYGDFNSRL